MKSNLFLISLFFSWSFLAAAEGQFSIQTYKDLCGGKAYPACDGGEHKIDQAGIFERAKKDAIETARPLMLIVGGDWCGACVVFDKMVKESTFKEELERKFIYVKLAENTRSGEQLMKDLNLHVVGYPSGFVFYPEQDELKMTHRFMPTAYLSQGLEKLIADFDSDESKAKIKEPEDSSIDFRFAPKGYRAAVLLKPIGVVSWYGKDAFVKDETEFGDLINQGFGALNLFHYLDAIRSFNEVLSVSPNHPWAILGLYLALEHEYVEKKQEISNAIVVKLKELKKKGATSGVLNHWVDFIQLRHAAFSESYTLTGDEPQYSIFEIFEFIQRHEDSTISQKALFAWLNIGDLSRENDREWLAKFYEGLISQEAKNIAALHYAIHVAEWLNDTATANKVALSLSELPLQSAHAVHMYGHTLPQSGRWQEARAQFLKADAIHHQWAKLSNLEVSDDWHYRHNLELLGATLVALGFIDEAIENWRLASDDSKILALIAGLEDPKRAGAIFKDVFPFYESAKDEDWFKERYLPFFAESQLNSREEALKHLRSEKEGLSSIELFEKLRTTDLVDEKAQDRAANEIIDSIQARLQSGGFDGWSTSYLRLLRLKKFARILRLDATADKLEAYTFATRFSANCGSDKPEQSLTPCFEVESK